MSVGKRKEYTRSPIFDESKFVTMIVYGWEGVYMFFFSAQMNKKEKENMFNQQFVITKILYIVVNIIIIEVILRSSIRRKYDEVI